jgi:F-type H+-transporting ATPase subunit b
VYSVENRKSRVVNDLHETQQLKESAEKKLNEYNQIIKNSKIEAKKIIEDNKKKLDQNIEIKKQKFNKEIEDELSGVEKEIKDLKKSSLLNINNIAADTSAEIIREIIDSEVNKSNVSAIVNDISKRKVEQYL